jgi:hypothetical protein
MSINYPTLAHFRHFSSLLTNFSSTTVEKALQISPFYAKQTQCQVRQNEHKLFYSNEICKNGQLVIQTNKANSNPIQSQFNPIQSQLNPKQTQLKPISTPQRFTVKHDYSHTALFPFTSTGLQCYNCTIPYFSYHKEHLIEKKR